jgi:NAD-dependent SIR2 family protein deacetylase
LEFTKKKTLFFQIEKENSPNNCFNLTPSVQVKQMLDGRFSRVTCYADTRQIGGRDLMVKEQEEMKCPKCGAYMKEFACSYKCRNLNCRYTYETFIFAPANIQQQFQPDNGPPLQVKS